VHSAPYYPIQYSFSSSIYNDPSGYTCQISPQTTQLDFNGTQATVAFTITCQQLGGGGNGGGGGGRGGGGGGQYFVYVNVTDYYIVTGFGPIGAGWEIYSSVSYISGSGNVTDELLQIGGYTDTLYAQVQPPMNGYTCTINPSTVSVVNGSSYAFTVNCEQSSGGNSGSNYFVYVTVINDTLNAGWQVSSSVSSISGSGDVDSEQLQIGGPTDTLTASVTSPSGYACSISPGSTQATNGSTYTFTVSCVQSPYPPCPVTAPSVSSSPSGAPTPSSSASVSSIPYNQTETVTFTYNAPESGNNYVFQYWSIGGQTYY